MRTIPVADYIVEFFIANGVTDVFGYQGGMVCHIFDSLGIYKDKINYHSCGNEQGAAFAACGYAQATGKLGVIITTSGPGFTNALTGLANAWFDSVPVMLISGQVNTKDKKRDYTFRQFGFQEIQAVPMAEPIVKKAYDVDLGMDYVALFDEAYKIAFSGRKGPVYLDFPINVGREVIEVDDVIAPVELETLPSFNAAPYIDQLMAAKKPIIIAGGGISQCGLRAEFRELVDLLKIPVVPTMPGTDLVESASPYHVGFLGGTARREAGIVLKNTDFVLSLGTRMCNKAIGYNHDDFIPKATKLIRVDIDKTEYERQLKDCEVDVTADLRSFVNSALDYARNIVGQHDHKAWVNAVGEMQKLMERVDMTFGNDLVKHFTELMPEEAYLTLDVGNNLIYGQQSSVVKSGTRIFASNGLGSMGYAIPAALGMAVTKTPTYVVSGDGGAQMNIQELNTIVKLHLPVKFLILNNHVLGHIILFQDHYLDCRRTATTEAGDDYYSCDFAAVAKAYGIRSCKIRSIEELDQYKVELSDADPFLIEAEFEDCSMLPNIHGGLDPLTNGPELPEGLAEKVRSIME
ncbi:MAG: thiamine pyrophosphate-binding protein [Oscillospiraceae bacterium]|nr:thiamine pyrophosphate-binding protein [Oscillospiraceae bacterium]